MGDIGLIAALLILFYALLAMTVIPMILGKYLIFHLLCMVNGLIPNSLIYFKYLLKQLELY